MDEEPIRNRSLSDRPAASPAPQGAAGAANGDVSRRRFVRLAAAGSLGLALTGCAPTGRRTAGDSPPDVLMISIDDLNDWLSCLGGHPDAVTPHFDRLAASGVLFTNAHCSVPGCGGSRTALLTGVSPSRSGIVGNFVHFRRQHPNTVTVMQHFREHGYEVAGAGKIFHRNDRRSWDTYVRIRGRGGPRPQERPISGLPASEFERLLPRGGFDWGPLTVAAARMPDSEAVDWAIRQLDAPRPRPLFLAVGLSAPHLPWYVPGEHFERYPLPRVTLPEIREDDLADVPATARELVRPNHRAVERYGLWRSAVRAYLASIDFTDALLGRLLDALAASPRAERTVVVLWSDHGLHLGEKGHWGKFTLWEEATRVPLIIAAPGVGSRNRRCDAPVSLLDLYPTLIDLCDLGPRAGLDGSSLIELLEEPAAGSRAPAVTSLVGNSHSVRSASVRYTRYDPGAEELYDHRLDPMEWTNRVADPAYAATRESLARWIPVPRRGRRREPRKRRNGARPPGDGSG